MELLGLHDDEVPRLLVIEPTWWRRKALSQRLQVLDDVRELGMPDLWLGWDDGVPVAFSTAYGASRVVEPIHALGSCGTPVVVQVGACAGLQRWVRHGDVVLPERATIGEGVSQHYGGHVTAPANLGRVARAASLVAARGAHYHRGTIMTTGAALRQPPNVVDRWSSTGHLAVDLTASAVFTAASAFSMRAAAVLWCREERGEQPWARGLREHTEPFQDESGALVFDVARSLVQPWPRAAGA